MGCIKEIYQTHKDAEKAAKGTFKRTGNHMKIYKCEHCGFYHTATSGKKKMREVKEKKYPLKVPPKTTPIEIPKPQINIGYKPEKQIIHTFKVFKQ